MKQIGVGIITYKEESVLPCIKSFIDHVDQVVVVGQEETPQKIKDALRSLSKKHKGILEYYDYVWNDDFAAKRNFCFSKLNTEWNLWVDSDDVVNDPQNMRGIISEVGDDVGAIWFPYYYAGDEFGNVTTVFDRERLLRSKYQWVWKGRLHETISPLAECKYARTDKVIIQHNHLAGGERNTRNFRILYKMLEDEPNDKRIWLYLGHQNFAHTKWMEAAQWYLKFGTDKGAVAIERWQALCYCSKAMRLMKDPQCIDVSLSAISLYPNLKDGYLELAHSYFMVGELDKAITMANLANTKDIIQDAPPIIFVNPLEYTFNRLCLLAECHERKGEIEESIKHYRLAYEYRPQEDISMLVQQLEERVYAKKLEEAMVLFATELHRNREYAKVASLLACTPFNLRDSPNYKMLENGAQKYIEMLKDEPVIVEDGEGCIVNLAKSLNPIELLEDLDKKYKNVTVVAPYPGEGVDNFVAFSKHDMEMLLMSKEGRHIKNLRMESDRIVMEYDHKMPKGLHVRLFSGPGLEPWSPQKIKDVGEGGSETSAAWMAKALAEKGHQPYIFAANTEVWDGVIYRPYDECRLDTECDLFISVRIPAIFDQDIKAKQKWLWMHDIHSGEGLTPEVASNIDVIIALSKWHMKHLKRTYPFLKNCEVIDLDRNPETFQDHKWTPHVFPDGECQKLPVMAIIGDGILNERFDEPRVKVPNRFVWASSSDRGLEELLVLWPGIKHSLPDAELKIYYGFEYLDSTLHFGPQREFKERIRELIKQDGVEWCGRKGQDELAKLLTECEYIVYPPPHQFRETYGIAFLEMQAAEVVCFYRKNGALGETVGKRGIPLDMKWDPNRVLEEIVKVTSDRDLCGKMRRDGKAYAATHDWRNQADKFIKLYKRMVRDGHKD